MLTLGDLGGTLEGPVVGAGTTSDARTIQKLLWKLKDRKAISVVVWVGSRSGGAD